MGLSSTILSTGEISGAVTGLPPAGAGHGLSHIGGVSSHGHTAGLDVVVEGEGAGQLDEGDVVGQSVVVPVGVGPAVVGDDRTSTEPGVVNEESHLPGPLVLLSLETSDNSVLGWRSLDTALSGEVVRAGLVGGLALLVGPDGPGQSDELMLHRAGLGLDQSVSGG